MVNFKKTFRRVALPIILAAASAFSQNLDVKAYTQRGDPLPGAQVTVESKSGKFRGLTNQQGVASFDNVSDTVSVTIAKDNYVGGVHKMFVDSDTSFSGALFDKTQYRVGKNNTGIDTVNFNSEEWKSVFGAAVSRNRRNPWLFDVQSSWPNYNIPVDVKGFSSSDSLKIWGYLNYLNDFYGKTLFIPGKVDPATTRGIIARPTQTGSDYTSNGDLNGYIKSSTSNLTPSLSEWVVHHEIAYHGLIYTSGHWTSYSPTNFNTAGQKILGKDALYMDSGYLLQFLRQTNKSNFDMVDYHDSVSVSSNVSPSSFSLSGVSPDSVKYKNIDVVLDWVKAFDFDNDSLKYLINVSSDGWDTTLTSRDNYVKLSSNALQPNKTYTVTGRVTDGLDTTDATNVLTFKTADNLTGVKISDDVSPSGFDVSQNFPNPFNPTTTIQYQIPKRSVVKVEVYDALGRVIDAVSEGTRDPGLYQTTFNLNNKSSGMYIYKVTAVPLDKNESAYVKTRKMLLLK